MPAWPYNTQQWARLRAEKLRDSPWCECAECHAHGARRLAAHVDHVLPVRQGGAPFARDNLMSLARSCHSRKTYHVDQGKHSRVPVRGCDPVTGKPLDPDHPFHSGGGENDCQD